MENSQIFGVSLIIAGLGSVAGGIYLLSANSNRTIERPAALNQPGVVNSPDLPLSPEVKGKLFEDWVIKKFDSKYFRFKEWRSDKYVAGIYPESSKNPDLQFEFHMKDRKANFAVECKWRNSFEKGPKPGISWATETQIDNYQRFQKAQNLPVFIVLGIGGTPGSPAELYIIPLERLKLPFASVVYLSKFRRMNLKTNFFYDDVRGELR